MSNLKSEVLLIFLQFSKGALDNEKKLDAVFNLEDILTQAVELDGVGDFDGNEFCEDTVIFFIYGKDANKIQDVVAPIIEKVPYLQGSYTLKRYKDSKEKQLML